ncbi:hypothetical protein L227DRAFT_546982 [Lentinus tigrinus ALCF2SS1-6]|uniref:F-box domain-containing protein n=1 Tax=Lentinus tigrinus ALCF2SS1-6 TaxID=1328759 RepID=A0A5C2SAC3_9APHY|nr:hypothetical protein L227DRAFT_546982 [Lentinus tigrinus ALCF2SS1-6]
MTLDDDSLVNLLEHLRTDKGSCKRLSSTCRRIRTLSMPLLFGRCRQVLKGHEVPSETYLVPRTLWPYIRTIKLLCRCLDGYLLYNNWDTYVRQNSDVICGPLANPTLHHALHNMPRLSVIVLHPEKSHVFGHGIIWETLCSFLSLPQLSQLVLDRVRVCPVPPDASTLQINSATLQLHPSGFLSRLEYLLPNTRTPYSESPETEALDRVLRSLHLSLEALSLPTEPAPMVTLSHLDWPRLRELKLRGLRWTSPDLPLVRLFACMPNLRVLVLELMEPDGASATALWPRGLPASYPWPFLESLFLSHPDPDDEIYAHLPSTLHTLKLMSWPHQCIQEWQEVNRHMDESRFYRPLPSPSVLLCILRKCHAPHLRELAVEYQADSTELSLLSHISSYFPRLTTFELHRSRDTGDVHVPVLGIAQSLTSLSQLRILKVNLNLPEMTPPMFDWYKREPCFWQELNPPDFEESLRGTATTFAQVLNPCLQQVWHFVYHWFQLQWRIYHVVRVEGDESAETRVEARTNVRYETEWI